jgi:hypothetical protein
MNDNSEFDSFKDVLDNFRRAEAGVLPVFHTPHGDAEAWRLKEAMGAGVAASDS